MIGGLIVTHGRLAIELLNAAEQIVGEIHNVVAVSLGWHDDVDTATGAIGKAIERVRTPDGVLILTDMFGGTPTNLASTYLDEGKVEIITGVNLPMLIKFVQLGDGQTLTSAAKLIRENGQSSIYIASDLLSPQKNVMKEREIVIGHRLGLHARAAAKLVQLSAGFQSNIILIRSDEAQPAEADARSILSILLLAARQGAKLQVRTDGSDEDEALDKVCEYLTGA